MSHPQIAVYPWIRLREPLTVCGVEFLPRAVAVERAGELGDNVSASTSYFYEHWLEGAPFMGHPLGLVQMEPSVVLLDSTTTQERIEIATVAWCYSTIFGNNAFAYANATTFQHFYQNIGGEVGTYARRTRRMHGTKLAGSLVMNAIDVRPHWCGDYHEPDEDMLPLLESVIARPDAEHLREALTALLSAMTDTDVETADAEHAHYARSIERLLNRHGQPRQQRDGLQRQLAKTLLQPMLPNTSKPYRILQVRDAVRNQRNGFWHPESSQQARFPFERQMKVRPNLIAFRAVSALVLTTIRDLLGKPLPDLLEVYPRAVEEWIAQIQENDPRDSEAASELGSIWSSVLLKMRIARHIETAAAEASGTSSTAVV